jgi:hypothetical protein
MYYEYQLRPKLLKIKSIYRIFCYSLFILFKIQTSGKLVMIKKLGLLVVFSVLVTLGSKAYVAFYAYQMIEQVKQDQQDKVAITYSWISSDFGGNIQVQGLVITPYLLKRSYSIGNLRLKFTDYIGLLNQLPNFKDGLLPDNLELELSDVTIPLQGRDFEQWLSLEYGDIWDVPLGLFACGSEQRVSHESLQEMGISEIRANLNLKLSASPDQEFDQLSAHLDLSQLGKIDVLSHWGKNGFHRAVKQGLFSALTFKDAQLTHHSSGYFRRLSNLCANRTGRDREQYSLLAAQYWRLAMADKGIMLSSEVQDLYRDYLLQGGRLSIDMNPMNDFSLSDFVSLLDQDIMTRFNVTASLNGTSLEPLLAYIDGKYFREPEPEIKAVQKASVEADKLEARRYQVTLFEDLEAYVGKKVKVDLKSGKQYQGLIKSVSPKGLSVSQLVAGGKVDYLLKPDQIEKVEIWRY